MHSKTSRTLARLDRAICERIRPAEYWVAAGLQVEGWDVGGEPVDPKIALGLVKDGEIEPDYRPYVAGDAWGAPWDTTWFHFMGQVPAFDTEDSSLSAWTGDPGALECVIDLGWSDGSVGFQCEGLVYRPDGTIVKALNPMNRWVKVADLVEGEVAPGTSFEFYVEAAANPVVLGSARFRPTPYSAKPTSYDGTIYRLEAADLCVRSLEVAELLRDLEVLGGLAKVLPEDSARRERIMIAIERALNRFDTRNPAWTAGASRGELEYQMSLPANASAHHTSAMGHAHIDSAWLWPLRETERKVARTVSNVLSLLEEHDDFIFTFSSAVQYAWLEKRYPELFAKLTEFIASGRIVPVGGMWVEPDGMLPSGESLARQMLLGQKYFQEHFGKYCDVMWLPDSFGYSGALPQLSKLGGMPRFLTQKISWNDTNKFPHHSFWWEGIDGTRVLTHFPPSDTYNAEVTAEELDRAAKNYQDKGISDNSILLFGYGDGGGGPTREMLGRAARFADLEDAPRVKQRTPSQFFDDLGWELADADSCWTGELYLEMHRGTFTSQANTKAGNRKVEALIREAEAAGVELMLQGGEYPAGWLESAWQQLLLGQFHDILPGSSIGWVYEDNEQALEGVQRSLNALLAGEDQILGIEPPVVRSVTSLEEKRAEWAGEATGSEEFSAVAPKGEVRLERLEEGFVLENEFLKVVIDGAGLVSSLVEKKSGKTRDLVAGGSPLGNLAIYKDEPIAWDAWDIDHGAADTEELIDQVQAIEAGEVAGAAEVSVWRTYGGSSMLVTYSLVAGSSTLGVELEVDWHEEEKLLKMLFPFDLYANSAKFETQFGYVERAIHENTSWDAARFEVPSHRWLQITEGDFGVGLVNDSSYGYSVGKPFEGGVIIGASALKSAKYPDPLADQGYHRFRWGIVPGGELADVIDQAELINAMAPNRVEALVKVEDEARAVRISAVKAAHDGSGDVIVRVYESLGQRASAVLEFSDLFEDFTVNVVDLLEDPVGSQAQELEPGVHSSGRVSRCEEPLVVSEDGEVRVSLTPFQVLSLRVKLEKNLGK